MALLAADGAAHGDPGRTRSLFEAFTDADLASLDLARQRYLRRQAMDAVDHLIALLDALDVDHEDMEDGHDAELDYEGEATLGAPEQHHNQAKWCQGANETDGEAELSLGAPEREAYASQASWAAGSRCLERDEGESEPGYDLPEGDDERDGGDGGRDDNESEPSLGATAAINQERWAAGDANDNELVNEDGCDNPDAQPCNGALGARPGENPAREVVSVGIVASNRETARDALRRVEAIRRRKHGRASVARDPDEIEPGNLRLVSIAGCVR